MQTDLSYCKEAHGLIAFGQDVARLSMVFTDSLKTLQDRYAYKVESQAGFEAPYLNSANKKACKIMDGLITKTKTALQ